MTPTTLEAPLSAELNRSGNRNYALGWAAYLACSWTWCIGMFLPVMLVRDYGLWGWAVFAVPNVVGAAAMGWVLRTPDQSWLLTRAHLHAGLAFSLVTLAFHVFFVTWLLHGFGLLVTALVALFMFVAIRQHEDLPFTFARGDKRGLVLAGLVLGFSVFAFAYVGIRAGVPEELTRVTFHQDLIWLLPVTAFGFLLCPYLDLTFHRTRRLSAGSSKPAFGIGFGLFFLAMIVFTVVYAPLLIDREFDLLFIVVALHITVQSAFTMAVHHRAMGETNPLLQPGCYAAGMQPDFHPFWRIGRIVAFIIAFALALAAILESLGRGGISGELIYRLFMAFYGLVFPAYVWLCMIPTWRNPTPPTRGMFGIFAASVLIAAPMYWMGFIDRQMIWLLPGVGIVLLARLLIRR